MQRLTIIFPLQIYLPLPSCTSCIIQVLCPLHTGLRVPWVLPKAITEPPPKPAPPATATWISLFLHSWKTSCSHGCEQGPPLDLSACDRGSATRSSAIAMAQDNPLSLPRESSVQGMCSDWLKSHTHTPQPPIVPGALAVTELVPGTSIRVWSLTPCHENRLEMPICRDRECRTPTAPTDSFSMISEAEGGEWLQRMV